MPLSQSRSLLEAHRTSPSPPCRCTDRLMYHVRARRGMSPSARPGRLSTTDTVIVTAVFVGAVGSVVLWAGAVIAAVLSGHPAPKLNLGAAVLALAQHREDPSAAWGQPVAPAWLYWTSTASVVAILAAAGAAIWWAAARRKTARAQDPRRIHGLASRREVGKVAGAKALTAHGVDCYASVEDSVVLLGPPRSARACTSSSTPSWTRPVPSSPPPPALTT